MTVACVVADEAVETIALDGGNTLTVEFITERRHGWKQEHLAHASTGRNVETGKLRLSIAVRRKRNGLVRFDGDLFKLDYDLSESAITRLYRHWHDLNADHSLPKRILRGMNCQFGKTTIIFDAAAEQVEEWKDFLLAVLTDRGSYVALNCPTTPRAPLAEFHRAAHKWPSAVNAGAAGRAATGVSGLMPSS